MKDKIQQIKNSLHSSHPVDIADDLLRLKKQDKNAFYNLLDEIPEESLGEVLLEFPESIRDKAYKHLSIEKLTNLLEELETDDATDIIKDIEEFDEKKANEILENLDEEDKQEIKWLKKYEDDEAGAYMQIELFSANISQTVKKSIEHLKQLKDNDE